ncbi:MAG: phosphate signaling complex protein PhoU [Alphaproteobacteria bacterium]|nr:phosphate signaling complex protein PhoU [Alphaproteobacteria bacterium]
MPEHTVRAFDAELDGLSATIAQMGGQAEAQLADAIEAISRRDTQLAERTIASDVRIDKAEREAESRAVRLLALRQPVAMDLRETIAALKIASDLERIGDLAKNIAKRALVLNREPPLRVVQSLARMGRQALSQLNSVLDAYSQRDPARAQEVWLRDEEIDEHYNSLFRELLTYMMEDPRTIGHCTHLLFVAKNIERIGDHATNIAETVHFLVKGEYLADERPKSDVTSTTNIDFQTKS